MRPIVRLASALVVIAAIDVGAAPAVLAQYRCQCLCTLDYHGRRHCRQVCTQPRYAPAPPQDYSPHYYYTPPYQSAGPQIDPDILLIGLGALVVAFVAGLAGVFGNAFNKSYQRDIEQIAADTATADEFTRKYEALEREADAHIAAALAKAREQDGDRHG